MRNESNCNRQADGRFFVGVAVCGVGLAVSGVDEYSLAFI